jgi:hypothetical protein
MQLAAPMALMMTLGIPNTALRAAYESIEIGISDSKNRVAPNWTKVNRYQLQGKEVKLKRKNGSPG